MDKNKVNVPKIRFPGFTDPWEQRKLGDVFKERSERSGVGELISVTINSGVVKFDELDRHDSSSKDKSNYKKVEVGDIAYNSMRMWQGASGYSAYSGILSPAYTVLMPKEGTDSLFYSYMFKRYEMIQIFKKNSQGLTSDTWNLKFPALSKIKIKAPNINEQMAISELFHRVDNLITLHQRKLNHLQDKKKSLLQKMFPKDGEDFPELRFPGFTDPWEQRKLGELGSVVMNRRIFKEQTSDEGDVPFYKIGTFGSEPDAFISRELFEEYKSKYPYPEKGDILISASGSIGRTVEYMGKDEYFQDSNIVWLRHDDQVINSFLKQFYSVVKWSGLEGSTIKRLYNKNILDTPISLPKSEEQKTIGHFFNQLDNLITLHQRKLNHLQQQKKGLLQQMFI